ncbi:MAG: ABC transporter permease, partial [Candidatus Bathyarchaeota archaeon]
AEALDSVYAFKPSYSPFNTELLVFLDREAVINPWDIQTSQETINRIVGQINNALAEYELTAYSNLSNALSMYNFLSITLRLSFLVVALPVFFVAWYVGTTVSDVSLNLRRREIGLLLTKGFSSRQLFRLFLSESLFVAILGGLMGVGLGFLLTPYFTPSLGSDFTASSPVLTPEVVVLTVIFSTAITLLSTFRPSRQAAKMPAVDALREYVLLEEMKPYRKRWPWIALILGGYKIIMFLIGIPSVAQFLAGRPLPVSNILLMILLAAWIAIDSVLVYLGPLLFFWGLTKVLIRGSLKFQEIVARAAKFLGDLGSLATKNVQRNPARAASVAFLIALIIGYGFQTVVTLASEEDYTIRQVKTSVGADVSLFLSYGANSSAIIENITNLENVESTTTQYMFRGETSLHNLQIIAVEPSEWLSTAYYEHEWFTGNNVQNAFQHLTDQNNTIIIELGVAKDLDLGIGDLVTLSVDGADTALEVVGFFGREITGGVQPLIREDQTQYLGSRFWSYVPASFYHSLEDGEFATERVLVKISSGANGRDVASQIRNFNPTDILQVQSVEEQLDAQESNLLLSGTSTVQRIGVIFAVLAGSVATGLVMTVSLQERKKEVAIMNVRGVSFRQLIAMLLCESLAIVVFAVGLGLIVGMIIANGTITAMNATLFTLVTRRITLPTDSIIILSISIIFVFALSIIPIILVSKRYISRLERIVRG